MKILTEAGEVGVHVRGHCYVLRPSLAAMSRLGDPAEIVNMFASVMTGNRQDALAVLFACSDDDLSGVFGYHDASETGIQYVPGEADPEHIVPLAQHLVKHGITGVQPEQKGAKGEYVKEFRAVDYVSMAVAHLSMSSVDAWQMTMTEFVGALRAKFPPEKQPGDKAPTKEEHTQTMAWYERVEAARKAKKGAH